MKAFRKAGVALAVSLSFNAYAVPITVDFEGTPQLDLGTNNLLIKGVRFSSWCAAYIHLDRIAQNGTYLAADATNNCGRPPNANYLGDKTKYPSVWIDAEGASFTLYGLEGKTRAYAVPFVIESSKGGVYRPVNPLGIHTLNGPEWTDIKWFTLTITGDAFKLYQGWDNIRVDIPDPLSSAVPPVTAAPPPPVTTPPPVVTPVPAPVPTAPTNSAAIPASGGGGALPVWLLATLGAFAVRGIRR